MTVDQLTAAMKAEAGNAPAFGATIKFDFKGDGIIHLDGTGASNVITNDGNAAECTVSVSVEDFVALRSGELDAMGAFMGGQIAIDGDYGVAMKLQSLLA